MLLITFSLQTHSNQMDFFKKIKWIKKLKNQKIIIKIINNQSTVDYLRSSGNIQHYSFSENYQSLSTQKCQK